MLPWTTVNCIIVEFTRFFKTPKRNEAIEKYEKIRLKVQLIEGRENTFGLSYWKIKIIKHERNLDANVLYSNTVILQKEKG